MAGVKWGVRIVAMAAAGIIFVGGCSSSDNDPPPDGTVDVIADEPLSAGLYPELYIDGFCSAYAKCDATLFYNAPDPKERCLDLDGAFFLEQSNLLSAYVWLGLIGFDVRNAALCLAQWTHCKTVQASFLIPPKCTAVYEGIFPQGAPCDVDELCFGNQYCSGGPDCAATGACTCPGSCQPRLDDGESCNTGHQCTSENCSRLTKTCAPTPVVGADCTLGDQCTAFSACVDPKGRGQTTCQLSKKAYVGKVGQDCSPGTRLCKRGLACKNDICMETVPAGSDCTNAPCAFGDACTDDICVSPPGWGEACTGAFTCTTGLGCIGGVCTDRLPNGSTCVDSDYCNSEYCVCAEDFCDKKECASRPDCLF
jgi:hypothetical protein